MTTGATREATRTGLTKFEWGCIAVAAAAFLMRIPYLLTPEIIWDSAWYLRLARSFWEYGNFYLPWSSPEAPIYSGYWPPLFPIFLSPVVALLGPSFHSLVAGAMLSTFLLTLTVFFTTRDLYDRPRAFAALALIAASPAFLTSDSRGMSESLLAMMVVLTVWAFLKSLDKPWWLPVSGIFALLAYLGKASLGVPFVLLGVTVLAAFRVRYRGWRNVLRSPLDMGLAATALLAAAFFTFTRTEKLGGIGLTFISPLKEGIGNPVWVPVFFFKVLFVAVFLLAITLPFSLHVRKAWAARKSERNAALWLAVLIPMVAGAIFTTTFYITEHRPIVDFDNIRYLTPAIVPFIWLMMPFVDLAAAPRPAGVADLALHRRHMLAYAAAVGSLAILFLFSPMAPADTIQRLLIFLMLALVPFGLAAYTLTTHYRVTSRRTGGVEERRLTPSTPAGGEGQRLAIFAGVGVVFALFVSTWYAYVAIALAIASTTMSPRARVLAIALLVMVATAPGARTYFPVEETADGIAAHLPVGALVGAQEPIVYYASVAHDDYRLTLLGDTVPDNVDAVLLLGSAKISGLDNFTLVEQWHYGIHPDPTVRVELAIEKALTGDSPALPEIVAYRLYVRNAAPEAGA